MSRGRAEMWLRLSSRSHVIILLKNKFEVKQRPLYIMKTRFLVSAGISRKGSFRILVSGLI